VVKRIFEWIDRILWGWSILLISLMTAAVIVSVFLRYVLSITFVWAEEVITMLFISTTFFGAIQGVKEDEHISITTFIDVLPRMVRKLILLAGYIIIFGVQLAILLTSISWIDQVGANLTPGLRIPIRFFYYIVPVSSCFILFYVVRRAVGLLFSQEISPQKPIAE
jgi:TRAP-type C4-dicarboxylate transport system permease small subunit